MIVQPPLEFATGCASRRRRDRATGEHVFEIATGGEWRELKRWS